MPHISKRESNTPECDAFGFLRDNSFLYISYVSNNQIYKLMITQPKEQYISPECEVLKLCNEGIICGSGEVPDMKPGWEWNF